MTKEQLKKILSEWKGSSEALIAEVSRSVKTYEENFNGVISGQTHQMSQAEAHWTNIGGKRYPFFLACVKYPGQEIIVGGRTTYIVVINEITQAYESSNRTKPDTQRLVLVNAADLS